MNGNTARWASYQLCWRMRTCWIAMWYSIGMIIQSLQAIYWEGNFYLIKWSYLILLNISIIGWCWSITMVFIIINRKILYDGLTHLQIHIFYVFIDLFSTAKMAFSFILKCQILISPKLFSYWKKSPPNLELLITGDRVMDNFSDSNMSPVKTILLLWNQNWKLE